MNELPPKSVKEQLVRLDDNLKQIERKQVSGIQRAPGSLPVLEAFQSFLEAERRQARRRLMGVTVFSLAVILAFAGIGTAFIYRQSRVQGAAFGTIQTQTGELASRVTSVEKQHETELAALAARFSDESARIVEQYRTLLDTQATLGTTLTSHESSVAALMERLTGLETENASLKAMIEAQAQKQAEAQVASVVALPPPVAVGDPAVATRESRLYIGQRRRSGGEDPVPSTGAPAVSETNTRVTVEPADAPVPEAPESVAEVAAPAPVTPAASGFRLVTMVPKGQEQGIRWMLPAAIIQE